MESLRLQIEASLGRSRDMLTEDRYRRLQLEGGGIPPHRYYQHIQQNQLQQQQQQQHTQKQQVANPNSQGSNPSTPGGRLKKQLHLLAKRTIGKKQGSGKGVKYPDEVSPIYWRHPREKFGSVSALSTSAIYGELRPPPMSYAAIYGGSTGVRHSGGRRGSAAALGGVHVAPPRGVGRATASPWETFLNIGEPIYEDVAQEMLANQRPDTNPCTCSPNSTVNRQSPSNSVRGGGSSMISPKRKSILPEKIELYALTEERLDGEVKTPSPTPQIVPVTPARKNGLKNNQNNRLNSAKQRGNNQTAVAGRRATANSMGKKMEANPFSSVASRKSILECDMSAYDMVKQYLRSTEMDSEVDEDDLSDNAVDIEKTAAKNLTSRWSEERRSTGSESDAGIGGSESSLAPRLHHHNNKEQSRTKLVHRVQDPDDGFVSVPEPDYDDEEDDSDASYDLSKFKDLRISYSPPPVRKPASIPSQAIDNSVDDAYRSYSSYTSSVSSNSYYAQSPKTYSPTLTQNYSLWPSKKADGRPSVPPPPPPPLPQTVAPIPPPLPPRSPTTRVQTVQLPEPKPELVAATEVIPSVIVTCPSVIGLRSILKKNSSGRSDRPAPKRGNSGDSKQVRFGGNKDEDTLVVEHIEDTRWDSEGEVPAECLPPDEQLPGSPSHTDQGFQSVSDYLSGPLRSAWNLRNTTINNSTTPTCKPTANATAEPVIKTTNPGRSKDKTKTNDSGFEFEEFDPADAKSQPPTVAHPKNGYPSPAVPRPKDDVTPPDSPVDDVIVDIAASGQRGKVLNPPSSDIGENDVVTSQQTMMSLAMERLQEATASDITKHGASTFYVSAGDYHTDRTTISLPECSHIAPSYPPPPIPEEADIYADTRVEPIYADGHSGEDPIYEELPDDLEFDNEDKKDSSSLQYEEQPRSFFEGASRAEILLYLEDARQRGVVLSEHFLSEINEIEEEARREEEENNRNNRISTLSNSSTGSSGHSGNDDDIDDDYVMTDSHEERDLQGEVKVAESSLKDTEKLEDQASLRNGTCAEVERADSGVGPETSKPTVRLRRLVAKQPSTENGSQDGTGNDEQLCADCDQPVEPIEDELSWMLFSPLVCKKCDRRRVERKEIISEIVETELKYGRDLRIIKEEFQRPMEVAGLLTKEQLRAIFLNLDELIRVNGQFAEKLHDAADIGIEQGDEDYTTVNIGRLFLESTTMLHAFETYCVRQGSSSLLLNNLEKEKELLRIFLRVSQMENTLLRRMNLPAFLMVPVQRVTKYPLLLSRLHKVTPYHHQDREALREAQHKIELHLEHINQQTKGSGATRIWRRISNISSSSHKRINNLVDDISSIKLRKMALEVLKWNRDEVRFVLAGRLMCAPVAGANRNSLTLVENGVPITSEGSGNTPNSNSGGSGAGRRLKGLKLTPLHGLLVTLGKPNANYRPETADDEDGIFFPRNTGIRDATLLLIREKNGRLTLFRGPLHLGCSVISDWEGENDAFEIQEYHTKEAYVFKGEYPKETKDWCHQLRYHAKDLGNWRRRRNALANIMINGMVRQ